MSKLRLVIQGYIIQGKIMNKAFLATLLLGCALPSGAIDLSGNVIDLDSTARRGVVVSLSGTSYSDTTDASGAWSILSSTTHLSGRSSILVPVTNDLVLENGRIKVAFSGRGASGKRIQANGVQAVGSKAASRAAAIAPDTLIYSWNGRVFLRDTVSQGAPNQSGIIRHFDTTVAIAVTYGYVNDDQGHIYRTTKIGNQVWMAENLNYKIDSSWCYDDSANNCWIYGRLYSWAAAMDVDTSFNHLAWTGSDSAHRGICPGGWHMPSDSEAHIMVNWLDSATGGTSLKSKSGWYYTDDSANTTGNGTDTYGFRLMATGYRNSDGSFYNQHSHAALWSSTNHAADGSGMEYSYAMTQHFTYLDNSATRIYNYKDLGFSLRCVETPHSP